VHVVCYHGPVLIWHCCITLITSGFMDTVMFSYHGANGQSQVIMFGRSSLGDGISWTSGSIFGGIHQSAALGAKSGWLDCTLFLCVMARTVELRLMTTTGTACKHAAAGWHDADVGADTVTYQREEQWNWWADCRGWTLKHGAGPDESR